MIPALKFLGKWLKAIIISCFIVTATTFGWMPCIDDTRHSSFPLLAQQLKTTVDFLSNKIGIRDYHHPQNLNRAADYISEHFQELGYSVEQVSYKVEGATFRNVLAYQAEQLPTGAFLVGAHYDSCNNPGADDNASGVAGVLALAELLKNQTTLPIVFAAFVNEEPPFFTTTAMGSYVLVKHLQSRGVVLKGAIILEMIGFYSDRLFSQRYLPLLGPFYPNQASFLAVVGNFNSRSLVNELTTDFHRHSGFPIRSIIAPSNIPGIYFSDHWSFWQFGIPAVMVTDTAYLRNHHYHRMTDLPDQLEFQRMARVVDGLKSAILSKESDR